jgi:hypothetical protein
MIKATLTDAGGKTVLMLGLSFNNLNKFYREPGDTFIRIDGKEMGLPIDVLIFSGKTEADMAKIVEDRIGPNTIVHIDPKLKS